MTEISFKSAEGKELELGKGRLKLLHVEGFEAPKVTIAFAKGPGIDGAIEAKYRIEPRHIEIDALLDLRDLDEIGISEERKNISEAMNTRDNYGKLTVKRDERIRNISAMPCQMIFKKKRWNEEWQKVTLGFICEKPFFKNIEPIENRLRFYAWLTEFSEEGIEFNEEGLEFSRIENAGERTIEIINNGNVPAPIKIRFTGPVVDPYIKNKTTDETIRIDQIIKEGEYVEIDTEPGRRQIKLLRNGYLQNGMHYLDLESTFWKLKDGKNIVEIGDISPGEGSEALFEFYEHYLEA